MTSLTIKAYYEGRLAQVQDDLRGANDSHDFELAVELRRTEIRLLGLLDDLPATS